MGQFYGHSRLHDPVTLHGRRPTNCPQPPCGSFEVMNRTIDIAQAALARHTLAAYPPDLS